MPMLLPSLALLVVLAANGSAPQGSAGQAPQPSTEQLLLTTLKELDGREIAVTRLVYPPGASVMEHRHRAFIAAYVVSGQVESALDDQKPVLYGPGDVWFESHMQLHRVFRNPSATEPFVVIVFALRDAPGRPVASRGATDWPQFRGPDRNGVATTFTAPAVWPEQLTRKWQIAVGEGYATPILVGDRLYVFTRQGGNEVMQALDATTGASVWQTSYPAAVTLRPGNQPHGPGPKSTPTFADGRLFTLGMSGTLTAFDAATGTQLWQVPGGPVLPLWNTAISPLVERGLVIVHVGGHGQGALTAFDAASGAAKWSWTGDGPSYASPVVATLHDVRQIITLTQEHVVGVSAADGQLLWKRPFPTSNQNIIMPIVADDTVVVAGYQKPTSAFRVLRTGDEWTTEDLWQNPDVWQFMTNGVMVGDRLFGLSMRNRGEYFLLDTKSGAKVWNSSPRQAEHASIVRAGESVIALEDDGELVVGRVDDAQFQEVRRYTVADAATWAAPVLSGNRIFIKDVSTLALWTLGDGSATGPAAQSEPRPGTAMWETLARAPLPEEVEPVLSINSLTLPAEPVPRVTQPHTHTGPVVGYLVAGEIENQVEPEPPIVHKAGGVFLEPPGHVHRILRNLRATEPATLIIAQVGRTRVPEALITPLLEGDPAKLLQSQHQWQTPLRSVANQEFRVFRLKLPVGASAESVVHSGPGLVYVLEGTVTSSATSVPKRTYSAGDLFLDPSYRIGLAFSNASEREPATLLLYHVTDRGK